MYRKLDEITLELTISATNGCSLISLKHVHAVFYFKSIKWVLSGSNQFLVLFALAGHKGQKRKCQSHPGTRQTNGKTVTFLADKFAIHPHITFSHNNNEWKEVTPLFT